MRKDELWLIQFRRPRSGGLKWLLRDDFNDERAAGAVDGTPATPGPGTRTVVDGGSNLSLSSGKLQFGGVVGSGDPGIWYGSLARAAGRLLVAKNVNASLNTHRIMMGLDTNATGLLDAEAIYLKSTGDIRTYFPAELSIGSYSAATDYSFVYVIRSTGSYIFVKGGAYSSWTLLWSDGSENTATTYPGVIEVAGSLGTSSVDAIRVPDQLWLPEPLAYDTFTGSNGTSLDAHASDASGPDGQGTPTKSWTEITGDFDIQSNRANIATNANAIATVDVSLSDVVIDCIGNCTIATGWFAVVARLSDSTNYWYAFCDLNANMFHIYDRVADSPTSRASTAVTFNASTDYTVRMVLDGQQIDCYVDGVNKISYGSASFNETQTKHGFRAWSLANATKFDNFTIFARDGYSELDKYIK